MQRSGIDGRSIYSLDNAGTEAPSRFQASPATFDAETIRHLEDLGVGAGWRCLEVGGGGGSIATWRSHRGSHPPVNCW